MKKADWPTLLALAENEVRAIVKSLPANLQDEARRLPVSFEAVPSPELIANHIEPDTLGLFEGDAFPDADQSSLPLPPRIVLFLENLWDFAEGDQEVYREEIRRTYLHELGHYLGLDELDLEDRDLD